MQLYDNDIVDESSFSAWFVDTSKTEGKGKAKNEAKAFITWLENADDSDEDDE